MKKDMSGYLLIILSCICGLPGLHTEECEQTVLAKRDRVFVPEGGSLSLSCVVQHCGEGGWNGEWVWIHSSEEDVILKPSLTHRFFNETLSANQTRLSVEFINVNQSDEGSYGCRVKWAAIGTLTQGHFIYVNITSGLHTEECGQTVLAKRDTVFVPEGGSLSLSCVVQHCGEGGWNGEWVWIHSSEEEVILKPSLTHRFFNETLSANQTRLSVEFINVNQSDEGSYGCRVKWAIDIDQGQFIYVNITAVLPSKRNVLYRVLLCVAASLCFPLALGLACCLRSEVKPQPLPKTRSISLPQSRAPSVSQPCLAPKLLPRCPVPQKDPPTRKATPKPKPKTEPVYAALSPDAQATVYSSLRVSGL